MNALLYSIGMRYSVYSLRGPQAISVAAAQRSKNNCPVHIVGIWPFDTELSPLAFWLIYYQEMLVAAATRLSYVCLLCVCTFRNIKCLNKTKQYTPHKHYGSTENNILNVGEIITFVSSTRELEFVPLNQINVSSPNSTLNKLSYKQYLRHEVTY